MISLFLSEISSRNSGHSVGLRASGILISQYGSGSPVLDFIVVLFARFILYTFIRRYNEIGLYQI